MLTLRKSLSTLLVLALSVAPVLAESNEAKIANPPEANSNKAEAASAPASPSLTSSATDANVMALLGLLVMKGVLAPNEANTIRNTAPTAQFQALVEALKRKGVVSAADLSTIPSPAAPPSAPPTPAEGSSTTEAAATSSTVYTTEVASAQRQEVAQNPPQKKPSAPNVVPAVVPLRVLPIDPPVKDGLIPSFKVGAVKVTPYGFIKATVIHDSSDPNGDDFPFPGIFLNSSSVLSTGPTQDPSFHIKVRSSRFGSHRQGGRRFRRWVHGSGQCGCLLHP
jgi:hypothetical protein